MEKTFSVLKAVLIAEVVAVVTLLAMYGIIPRDILVGFISALVGYGGGQLKSAWSQRNSKM